MSRNSPSGAPVPLRQHTRCALGLFSMKSRKSLFTLSAVRTS